MHAPPSVALDLFIAQVFVASCVFCSDRGHGFHTRAVLFREFEGEGTRHRVVPDLSNVQVLSLSCARGPQTLVAGSGQRGSAAILLIAPLMCVRVSAGSFFTQHKKS